MSSDHNVEGMEVTSMVQNAIKIMEELATLLESMPDQNNHDRGQGGVDNDMGLGETIVMTFLVRECYGSPKNP